MNGSRPAQFNLLSDFYAEDEFRRKRHTARQYSDSNYGGAAARGIFIFFFDDDAPSDALRFIAECDSPETSLADSSCVKSCIASSIKFLRFTAGYNYFDARTTLIDGDVFLPCLNQRSIALRS